MDRTDDQWSIVSPLRPACPKRRVVLLYSIANNLSRAIPLSYGQPLH